MKWRMQCDEDTLREVSRGALGPQVAELMLDAIEGGVVIEVVNGDGTRRVTDRNEALELLAEVRPWTGEPMADEGANTSGEGDGATLVGTTLVS